jgi:hypothetical protein
VGVDVAADGGDGRGVGQDGFDELHGGLLWVCGLTKAANPVDVW